MASTSPTSLPDTPEQGAVQVFEFEHRPGADVGIGRDDVIPPQDPFLEPLAQFLQAIRRQLLPDVSGTVPQTSAEAKRLERANTVLGLGLRSARACDSHRLADAVLATVFDQIEGLGQIRFRYLMLVEHERTKAFVCAITAEPMAVPEQLQAAPAALLATLGLGTYALRVWVVGGSTTVATGQWSTISEFTAKALEVARGALPPV